MVLPGRLLMLYDEHKISTGGACHGESETEDEEASQEGGSMEWNSDDDGIIDPADDENGYCYYARQCVFFLGFHPYKEVIFLDVMGDPVACHLGSGKVQYLGVLHPGCYNRGSYEAFVYTPCLIGV